MYLPFVYSVSGWVCVCVCVCRIFLSSLQHFKALEVEQPGVPVKGVGLLIGIVPPEAMNGQVE